MRKGVILAHPSISDEIRILDRVRPRRRGMMFFVPTDECMDVIRTFGRYERQVSNRHFTKHGTKAWRVR